MEKKEAMKILKDFYDKSALFSVRTALDTIIPQLKESEDEKIRKALINFFEGWGDKTWDSGIKYSEVVAWLHKQGKHANFRNKIQIGDKVTRNDNNELVNLSQLKRVAKKLEKHGEQKYAGEYNITGIGSKNAQGKLGEMIKNLKPANKVEPKFNVGDWVVTSYGMVNQVIAVDEDGDGFALDDDTYLSGSWKDNFHLWTIQDAKDGDVLYSPCLKLLWIFNSRNTVYCGCNLNYNDGAFCGEGYFERPTDAIPATKEQRDLLFQKMKEAGYEWDAEKKELKIIDFSKHLKYNPDTPSVIEQTPAWSEEDEGMANDIIDYIRPMPLFFESTKGKSGKEYTKKFVKEAIKWLKSLKDRVGCEVNCTTTKEVDFERELSKYVSKGIHRFFPNEGDDYYNMDSVVWQDYVIETAKHFYELGIQQSKK